MNENKTAEALELREEWLRVAGLSEPEARELARAEVPGLDVEEERANLAAARRLADDTATTSTLLALAKRSARARQRSAEADVPRPAVPT